MSVPDFLDSNVLVYAYDDGEPQKQQSSRELLSAARCIVSLVITNFRRGEVGVWVVRG
jgi:predicted nucleic acid-binding protein